MQVWAFAALLFCLPVPTLAQNTAEKFDPRIFTREDGSRLPYRIFIPTGSENSPLPAIIYLHGSGGLGIDNLKQISGGNTQGTHLWIRPEIQARQQVIVIAPQLPAGSEWAAVDSDLTIGGMLVLDLIDTLIREKRIDADRIYLVGQSLGGFGVWDLISKRPDVFAAAIALCGGGRPDHIAAARTVPIWAFHGAQDTAVPVQRSREMVAALEKADGTVKYTEYPAAGHDIWTQAFAEPELPTWLFANARNRAKHEGFR